MCSDLGDHVSRVHVLLLQASSALKCLLEITIMVANNGERFVSGFTVAYLLFPVDTTNPQRDFSQLQEDSS